MRFIELTGADSFHSYTFVDCNEIAAVRLDVVDGNSVTKVVLKSGIEIAVKEAARDVVAKLGE